MQQEKEYIRTSLRIEKQLWKEFRKWLIENDYKSFHQFVVECMEKALKGKLKPKPKEGKERDA
jgi:hypothetical protein